MKPDLLATVLLAILCGVYGVLVTALAIKQLLSSMAEKKKPNLCFENINLVVKIQHDDGQIDVVSTLAAHTQGMTARLVEQWLENRGLMMVPKAEDFKVKVKS